MTLAWAGLPAIRDTSVSWQQFMGIDVDRGGLSDVLRQIANYANQPADEAWLYRCVSLKAAFAAGVPLRVFVREGKMRIPAEDTADAAARDLAGLLDDANPVEMNGGDLKAWTVAARAVWGEAYWRKVRGRLGGPPQELYWRRAPDIEPVRGRGGWPDSYEYRPLGNPAGREIWSARDVIPFRTINLANPLRGLSPLSAARLDLATNRAAGEWTAATLLNHGVPETVWTIPKDAEFTEQDKSLVRRVLRSLRGPRSRGKTAILPKGLEPKVLSLNPKDAEWLAARKVSRMTICAVQGVPLVLAGDDDKASVYANLRDAERVFARHMISELDWIADALNGWLVPDFDPAPPGRRRIVVAFDYSEIEALQAPLEDRKRVALAEVERGILARDEYRAEFRLGPPLPAGVAQFAVLANLVPIPVTPDSVPSPEITLGTPELDAGSQRDVRRLYRVPEVRAWLDGTATLDAVADLLGVAPTPELEVGLRRRYTARQLREGVPAEGFAGLVPAPPRPPSPDLGAIERRLDDLAMSLRQRPEPSLQLHVAPGAVQIGTLGANRRQVIERDAEGRIAAIEEVPDGG